jgi:hypothetical protein
MEPLTGKSDKNTEPLLALYFYFPKAVFGAKIE